MRLILTVFDALRTFDRPCTRAEIESASGLKTDDVGKGLKGLMRRRCLRIVGEPRRVTTFALVPGAARPLDLRGIAGKSDITRRRIAAARRAGATPEIHILAPLGLSHRAAMPPSHRAEPGALRVVKKGLGLSGGDLPTRPCALAEIWRKR